MLMLTHLPWAHTHLLRAQRSVGISVGISVALVPLRRPERHALGVPRGAVLLAPKEQIPGTPPPPLYFATIFRPELQGMRVLLTWKVNVTRP